VEGGTSAILQSWLARHFLWYVFQTLHPSIPGVPQAGVLVSRIASVGVLRIALVIKPGLRCHFGSEAFVYGALVVLDSLGHGSPGVENSGTVPLGNSISFSVLLSFQGWFHNRVLIIDD
jgi:hypothetical protein